MIKMKLYYIVFIGITLVGCAGNKHYFDATVAQESATCTTDTFSNQIKCSMKDISTDKTGRNCTSSISISSNCPAPRTSMHLYVVHNKSSNRTSIELNGRVNTLDWFYPYKVLDNKGKEFTVTKVDSDIGACSSYSCSTYEYISIGLEKQYINAHIESGITMKLYGKHGEATITLPSEYVKGFKNLLKANNM